MYGVIASLVSLGRSNAASLAARGARREACAAIGMERVRRLR
jgi:hypothetical protein